MTCCEIPEKESPITALRPLGARAARIAVELDGAPWRELEAELILLKGLRKGMVLSASVQEELLRENQFIQARRAAYILLHTRTRSEMELRRALRQKGYDEETVNRCAAYLLERDDINDGRFAREMARRILRDAKSGPEKARRKLLELGVEKSLAEAALEETGDFSREALWERMEKWWQSRKSRYRKGELWQRKRKVQAALMRAGFDGEMARAGAERFVMAEEEK